MTTQVSTGQLLADVAALPFYMYTEKVSRCVVSVMVSMAISVVSIVTVVSTARLQLCAGGFKPSRLERFHCSLWNKYLFLALLR